MKAIRIVILLAFLFIWSLPAAAQPNPDCVTDYDPDTDYFPDKVTIRAAEHFSVQYENNYKVVTVTDAFDNAPDFTYVLLQCGTPPPANATFPEGTQFVEVPMSRVIAMSTTQLPHLVELGQVDTLVGMDSFLFASTPEIQERIASGDLVEVSSGTSVNVELVLETEPDLVMAYGFDPDTDAYPILLDSGVFTALNGEWREATPLARAEWIKYTSLFFNAEAEANAVYENIVTEYEAASTLANSVPEDERPVVLWNSISVYSDAWGIPGTETFAGVLIEDAGGVIAMGDEAPDGGQAFLSFEAVYAGALDADVWMPNLFGITSLEDILALDPRFADFDAVQAGNVWNNDLDVNENGGNNFYEAGVTHPHLILQDMVAVFHPELLPDHTFNFFRPLPESGS